MVQVTNPDALVVSLDVNLRTLARHRPYYEKLGVADRMVCVVADARNMPFRDDSFDSVTSWGGLVEIENPDVGLRETYRVLRSGGWFGISGDQYREGSPSMEIAERIGMRSLATTSRLESVLASNEYRELTYDVVYEGYDIDLDTPDDMRCPLPARGDWFQIVVGAGRK
jgi:ubiquinone/menaquinone biosynthesis C-methylase UbiE